LPRGVRAITAAAMRMPGGDGVVPDIVVTTADLKASLGALEVDDVHTIVEVVSPSNALVDRADKRELYAEAGIPCHWRVELEPWRGYSGPLPLVVVRLRAADGWHTTEAAAGAVAQLPLAVGRANALEAHTIVVKFDPAALVQL
jgi:Uma2 family endonuclease